MAEPHDPKAAADRYAAIEAAYCDDRWQEVLSQGQQLLGDLGPADDALATALRQRVQLLMAHTHLHGFGDRDNAEDLYRQVLSTPNAEPALRHSAEEGLQQCDHRSARPPTEPAKVPSAAAAPTSAPAPAPERPLPEPVAPPLAVDAALPFAAATGASSASPVQTAATPWLEANPEPLSSTVPTEVKAPPVDSEPSPPPAAAPSLLAEVVEEPELLDVHQADPLRAEEIELELRDPPSTAAAAAQVLAAAAAAEAMAEVATSRADATTSDGAERQSEPTRPADSLRLDIPPREDIPSAVLLEQPVLAEPEPGEPARAESPPPIEEEDDPDLLEGLLQVALG